MVTIFKQVCQGRIQCLIVEDKKIICGGANGFIGVLDCRSLDFLNQFSLAHSSLTSTPRPQSARPKSASIAVSNN